MAILKYYGPYKDREKLYISLDSFVLLGSNNLILAGDIIFTLSPFENWGSYARVDRFYEFFSNLFQRVNLVDIFPIEIDPTWSNGRCGVVGISKILDRFFMNSSLI